VVSIAMAMMSCTEHGRCSSTAASQPQATQFACAAKTTLRNDVTASHNPQRAENSQRQLLATNFANQISAIRGISPIRGKQLFLIH